MSIPASLLMVTRLGVCRPVLVYRNDVGLGSPVGVPTVAVARTSLRSVRATAYGGTATRRFAPRLLGPSGLDSRIPASLLMAPQTRSYRLRLSARTRSKCRLEF